MAVLGRHSLFGMAVVAATGVPYALHTATDAPPQEKAPSLSPTQSQSPQVAPTAGVVQPGKPAAPAAQPLEGAAVANLAEVFNFDVTTAWILGRWPRVMTSGWGNELQAYRVPLVTGPRDQDLAGSLTYYFDREHRAQWITFLGATGDARPLVDFASRQHGLKQHTTSPGEYDYRTSSDGAPVSQLAIKPRPVQRADESHARFAVEMRLKRPSSTHQWYSPAQGLGRPWQ